MKIGEKTFVALSYQLKVDGQVVETVKAQSPLQFVYGTGFLLPAFEANLAGLGKGDPFAFRLDAANAYGEVIPDAVVELPKEVFMVDGKIEDGMLEIGNQLPMSDNQGNRLVGVVKAVGDDSVTMDFNHPMAGKALEFSGTIVEVREATPEDMMTGHPLQDNRSSLPRRQPENSLISCKSSYTRRSPRRPVLLRCGATDCTWPSGRNGSANRS